MNSLSSTGKSEKHIREVISFVPAAVPSVIQTE
jgi:hypothetical protein